MKVKTKKTKIDIVVAAAGKGTRMELGYPKQHTMLVNGKTILEETLSKLIDLQFVNRCIVVLSPEDNCFQYNRYQTHFKIKTVLGGETRGQSVFNAIEFLFHNQGMDYVLIHDAARPCINEIDLYKLVEEVEGTSKKGAILVAPIHDSVKRSHQDSVVSINREGGRLWRALTPQIFPLTDLYNAFINNKHHLSEMTDEASIMERDNYPLTLIEGAPENIKVTNLRDLDEVNKTILQSIESSYRVGAGIDFHAFCEGDYIVLGGVQIPYIYGVKAHSDGDVLLHALCDALLGACALGDIGQYFPNNSKEWHNADSRDMLKIVNEKICFHGAKIINIDLTIIAQAPRVLIYKEKIIENIALDLAINNKQVSVKATTTEKLGFIGRGEGLGAQAQVLIIMSNGIVNKESIK